MSFKVPDNFVFRGSCPMIGRYATFLKPLQPTQCWPDALLICLSKLGTDSDGGGRQKKTSISSFHRVSNSAERMYVT